MIDRGKEVTTMLSNTSLRRLCAAVLMFGVLAAVTPAAGLAANPGGGGRPTGQSQ
jgi:hypothetical protein